MRVVKKAVSGLLCLSLIANNASSIMALTSIDEINDKAESTQVIKLDGEVQKVEWTTSDTINLGQEFDAMNGVKALDKDGNDITDKIQVDGNVDTSKAGEYKIGYFIKGEEDKKTYRTVKVIDENTQNQNTEQDTSSEVEVKTQIKGNEIVRAYIGQQFDPKFDINATDENGKDITSQVQVEGNVDTNTLGQYELKYSVKSDSGQEATFIRTVKVIEKNVFNFYINKDNKNIEKEQNAQNPNTEESKEIGFSLYMDLNTSKFIVENQSPNMLDEANPKDVYANIKVFDKDNNEKLSLELLGEDTGNSEKFKALQDLEYEYGDFIHVTSKNPKDNFNITGKLPGDVITELSEELPDVKEIQENYADGVDNLDYIDNVRFEIVEDGIKTVYNKAPEITGLSVMDKLLTKKDEQLEGVSVTDDHDEVIPNDKIEIVEEKDDKNKTIGLRYTVEDSWGRSTSVVRTLVENSSTLHLSQQSETTTSLSRNSIEVHGIRYQSDNNTLRFKLGFSQDDMTIKVTDKSERKFDNKITDEYFKLVLYDKYGASKATLTLNGDEKGTSKKLEDFNNTKFEYGDQIYLFHYYSDQNLKIKGTIDGENSPYQNGIPKNDLEVIRFELNQDGLKKLTNNPPVITWENENLTAARGDKINLLSDIKVNDDIDGIINKARVSIIKDYNPNQLGEQTVTYSVTDSWGATTTIDRKITVTSDTKLVNTSIDIMDSTGENKIFSIKFDDYLKQLSIVKNSEANFDSSNPDDIYLTIRIFSKAGITKKEVTLTGNQNANNEQLMSLNGYIYNVGDMIELWSPKHEKAIKIIGDIKKDDEINNVDYSTGITDEDHIKNVRFQLEDNQLYAVYNNAPTIKFKDNLSIKRGEEFNPLSFIEKIEDDHDNLNIKLVKYSYDESAINNVGKHNIEYRISDKWGRSTLIKTEITVLPKNELEENKIKLLKQNEDGSLKAIATLHFDDVTKRIYPEIERNENIAGVANTDVFIVEVFDSNGESKAKSVIKANEGLNSSSFEEIESIDIEYNDSIHVEAYDKDKVSIVGTDYESGFTDDDNMKNTRFTVNENGLEKVYNSAPEIIGADDTAIVKGATFDPKAGVTVEDDHDGNREITDEEIIGTIDTSTVGVKYITYRVTDSWGRTTEKTREVYVKPIVETNTIELKNSNDQLAFKIGFDFKTFKFTVTEQSDTALNPLNAEKEFVIAIYDSNNNYIKHIELLGTDTGTSEKLNELKNTYIRIGAQIRVWSKDSTKLSIKGPVIKDSEITENYEDGIDDTDFMNNVIFQGTESGLKALYNSAPVINLPNTTTDTTTDKFTLYKGDNYREDLLKDVTIANDDGDIDKDKINIDIIKKGEDGSFDSNQRSEIDSINSIGEYKAIYSVEDKWGRKSDEVEREFEVVPSIDRNEIWFGGYKNGTGNIEAMFKVGFNSTTKRIEIRERRSEEFNNGASSSRFYVINVYNQNGQKKIDEILLGTGSTPNSIQLNRLDNLSFEYGDYINIKAYQTFRMKIKGPVRNPVEKDENGYELINQGDDFINTNFYITEEGLKAKYVNPVELLDGESLIEFVGNEGTPFKLKINHNDGTFEYPQTASFYAYDHPAGNNANIFTVVWHHVDGTETEYHHKRRESAVNAQLRTDTASGFTDGDYFTFKVYNQESSLYNKIRLSGDIENAKEDYSDGINDLDNMENVRFYLRNSADGHHYMDARYNEAPKFSGVEDVNIYVGDDFDAKAGVTLSDDLNGENLEYTLTGSHNNTQVGKYQYTYSYTDSWGRNTTVNRNVYVRPNIYKNRIQLYSNSSNSYTTSEDTNSNQLFEIGFDNDTGKYTVTKQVNEAINPDLYDSTSFKIAIYDSTGAQKIKIELTGDDTGTSSKLDELKEINYTEGDYIKVWSSNPDNLKITGDITGDVNLSNEEDSDGISKYDYMNNVAFKATNDGLECIYNEAPEIDISNLNTDLLFGEDIDLKNGITVSDDKDSLTTDNLVITGEVNKDEIGSYTVNYTLTDSWGRSTSRYVTFRVVSKIKNNEIAVYGKSASGEEELKFTIKFNVENNKLEVLKNTDSNETLDSTDSDKYFEIVVRDKETEEKAKVEITGNDADYITKLDALKAINFANGDTISIYHKDKSKLRIKGNIENNENKDFQNSFPSDLEFNEVRFKVTNKGFELFKREPLNVSFNGNLTIKIGDLSNIYGGINFGFTNIDSYNGLSLEIKNLDETMLGTQNIIYVITDSWNQRQEVSRTIKVIERNNLEENVIKVLDGTSDRNELMEFRFDTINKEMEILI